MRGVSIITEDMQPFYMKGNGCFQKVSKRTEPLLKLDRRKMKRVRSEVKSSIGRVRSAIQLGHLDEEANQLLVAVHSNSLANASFEGRASSAPACSTLGTPPANILNDELTEEELVQIFRERKAAIDKKFQEPAQDPNSFMRQPEDPATREKLGKMLKKMRQLEEPVIVSPATVAPKRAAASLFLTSLGEEAADGPLTRSTDAQRPRLVSGVISTPVSSARALQSPQSWQASPQQALISPEASVLSATGGGYAIAAMGSPALSFAASLAAGAPPLMSPSASVVSTTLKLPAIHGASLSSPTAASIASGLAMSLSPGIPLLPDLRGAGSKQTSGLRLPMADAGVREAIRALRAAAMSEYAVAA